LLPGVAETEFTRPSLERAITRDLVVLRRLDGAALESMGAPLPGETMLIAAAILAGSTHDLDIWLVIASATAGANIGDNVGFWIGPELGFWLIVRYGRYVRL